ncbi:MAG: GPW/gp25 family protein, partial [Planctomycetales bacterium]|nr:GPW/gp25 family protein [Planctomycetales bacterium]
TNAMSSPALAHRLAPSLLDRLIEAGAGEARPRYVIDPQRFSADLADLLNAWIAPPEELAAFPLASESILGFGWVAPPELQFEARIDREEVASRLQRLIERFEPRLASVRVTAEGEEDRRSWGAFRIEAVWHGGDGRDDAPLTSLGLRFVEGRASLTEVQA